MCLLQRRYCTTSQNSPARLTRVSRALADRPHHLTSMPPGFSLSGNSGPMFSTIELQLQRSQTQSRCSRPCPPQTVDSREHRPEQLLGNRHFSHLEYGHPRVTDNLSAYLHELELYSRERPVQDLFRKCETPQRVTEVVCQDEWGEPHLVGGESGERQPGPGQGIRLFPDILLACS